MNQLRRVGAFWYDFLVDGRPELLLGPIVALAIVWVALGQGLPALLAGVLLVALVSTLTGLSLALALRRP